MGSRRTVLENTESAQYPRLLATYELLILTAIGVLTLEPLWLVGLTNTDDMVYSQLGHTFDWDSPLTNAIGMGRFYYLYSGFLYMLPYLLKNVWYFKLFAIGPLIAIPVLMGKVIQTLTGFFGTFSLTVLIYFVCLQMYSDYYPTAAFPFVFTFSICLFLLSYLAWLNNRTNENRFYRICSLSLFTLFILPYETFVYLFSFVFILTSFSEQRRKGLTMLASGRTASRELQWYGCVLLIYATAYLSFACIPPPQGFSRDHMNMSSDGFDLNGCANTVWHFSASSLPTASLFYGNTQYLRNWYWEDPELYSNFLDILRVARSDWWLRALLAGGLVIVVLSRTPSIKLHILKSFAIVGTFVFVTSPLLHALTQKYQQFVAHHVYVYLPTFFSYLGFVIASASLVLYLNGVFRHTRVFAPWLTLVAFLFGLVSLVHSFNNYHVARYQAHLSFTWTVMDHVLQSPPFEQLPEGATVYAPSLPRATVTYDMLSNTVGDYWEDYIHLVSGKRLHLIYSPSDLASNQSKYIYYLGLNKMPKDFHAFVVLGSFSVEKAKVGLYANEFDLMTYSKYKEFELSFKHEAPDSTTIAVEGQPNRIAESGLFKAPIVRGVRTPLVMTHVSGQAIKLDSIDVSFFKLHHPID